MEDVFCRGLSRPLYVRRGFDGGILLGAAAFANVLLVPTCCRFRGTRAT